MIEGHGYLGGECQVLLLLLNHRKFGSIVLRVDYFFCPARFVGGVPFGKDVPR